MQRQIGRLEAKAIAADVDDAGLYAFQRVGDLHHGATIAFYELNFIFGLFGDPLGYFRDEEALHQRDIGVGRRMARGDAQTDDLLRRRRRASHRSHEDKSHEFQERTIGHQILPRMRRSLFCPGSLEPPPFNMINVAFAWIAR